MSKKKRRADTEAFVRKVLTEAFKQKPNAATIRAVAAKVSEAVLESSQKQEPRPSKEAA